MYKLLLCWRYLRTRYLALICIISVMLGVGTLIVVNSVMSGFSNKLRNRLHGLLSDVVVESPDIYGFDKHKVKMDQIRNDPFLKDRIEAMAATMEIFAMLQFDYYTKHGAVHPITRTVRLIGVDPEERAKVGGFKEFLVRMQHRDTVRFELDAEGQKNYRAAYPAPSMASPKVEVPGLIEESGGIPLPDNSDLGWDIEEYKRESCILGYAIAHSRKPGALVNDPEKDLVLLKPGSVVNLFTINGIRNELRPVRAQFTVCDYIRTGMSEYDSNIVYVPLEHLQQLRRAEDRVTTIQIKLKNYADAKAVVKRLEQLFEYEQVHVMTWEQKQGPLLAAIAIEKGILNVLLFLIIAVAGFGILAIFSMIVMEKTRDIGVLKALGASSTGVMKIFLGYGLLLGLVGAVFGTALGLLITDNVNEIEAFLAKVTGQDIFPRDVYYFDRIPVQVDLTTVVLINVGAVGIAVLFSVLPALRAAMLHPVRALRFE